jgi:hypothetical protein
MSTGKKGNILGANNSKISFGEQAGGTDYGIWFYGGIKFTGKV